MAGVVLPTPSHSVYSDHPLPSLSDSLNSFSHTLFTRFIRLESVENGIIKCSLRVASLDKVRGFQALSYTWGPTTPTETILLNGTAFKVRRNLWQALLAIHADLIRRREPVVAQGKTVKFADRSKPASWPDIWVDAISIDQTNVLERNHQVQFMREIFSEASVVWAWIANEGEDMQVAVHEITRPKPFRPDQTNLGRLTPKVMCSLCSLFSQAYWKRMWIVQELILAKDVRFLYGSERFWWKDFHDTMRYLDESNVAIYCQAHSLAEVQTAYRYLTESVVWSIYRTRKLYKDSGWFDIFELVTKFHEQACLDPRDKIFALLGMARPGTEIRADYTLSNEKLLQQLLIMVEISDKLIFKGSTEHLSALLTQLLCPQAGTNSPEPISSMPERLLDSEAAATRIVPALPIRERLISRFSPLWHFRQTQRSPSARTEMYSSQAGARS